MKRKEQEKNIIRFYCKRCRRDFDAEVGIVEFGAEMPVFEKAVICDSCGAKYISGQGEFTENFELSEIGQSQLTELFLQEGKI